MEGAHPEISGWLMKGKSGGWRHWMKRWMELNGTKLSLYKLKHGQVIKCINLEEVLKVSIEPVQKRNYCFTLETKR